MCLVWREVVCVWCGGSEVFFGVEGCGVCLVLINC